jgi:two-component system chemotaxis response regulator CheY
MWVLVVDDQVSMRGLARYSLQQIGFRNVDDAPNGLVAYQKMQVRQFQLVISDWHMDGMDGLTLLKTVRANPQLKKTPFIMVTGQSDRELVVQAVQAGVNNYIVKPFTVATLKSKIEAVVGKLT